MSDDIRESTCCPSSPVTTGEDAIFGYRVDRNEPHPPPVVTCPDSFTAWMVDDQYVIPDFSDSILTDGQCALDSDFTIAQNPTPGTIFTIGGEITILITVTDRFGNSVDCSFNIDIRNPNTSTPSVPPNILPPWVYQPYLFAYWSANDTLCPVGATDAPLPCWFKRDLTSYLGNASPRHLSNAGGVTFYPQISPVPGFSTGPTFDRGSAYSNNASNGYLYVPDDTSIRLLNTSFTVRFWFNLQSMTDGATWSLVGKYSTVGYRIKISRVGSTYRLAPELTNGSETITTTYRLVGTDDWIYVAMVWDTSLKQLRLYIDGQRVETTTATGFLLSGEVSEFRIGQTSSGIAVGNLACWNMDSTDWTDSVNGYVLTPSNGPTSVAGKINNAARLTGAASLFVADDAPLRLSGTDFTIRLWLKLAASPPVSSGGAYITKWGSNTGWFFGCYSDDGIAVKVRHGINSRIVVGAVAHTVGAWQHVVITWNNSTSTLTQYINNVSVFTDGLFTTPDSAATHNLRIERPFADVDIDEVAIWTRLLSGAEITTDYNGGTGTSCPSGGSAAAVYTDEIGIWRSPWNDARVAEDYALMT